MVAPAWSRKLACGFCHVALGGSGWEYGTVGSRFGISLDCSGLLEGMFGHSVKAFAWHVSRQLTVAVWFFHVGCQAMLSSSCAHLRKAMDVSTAGRLGRTGATRGHTPTSTSGGGHACAMGIPENVHASLSWHGTQSVLLAVYSVGIS